MNKLQIEYVSKEQLKPYANNAKLHTDDLPYNTVMQRIKLGWDIYDVVNTPYKSRKKWIELNG